MTRYHLPAIKAARTEVLYSHLISEGYERAFVLSCGNAYISLQAALKAEELCRAEQNTELEHARLQLQAARYEADRAFEQYDLCDPKNR